MKLEGACHCGSVLVWFDTDQTADAIEVRACQCAFCRRHGAKTVSDPDGWLEVRAAPGQLQRYRFGLGLGDFLICRDCGTFVAVIMEDEGKTLGVLNVVGAGMAELASRDAAPMNYGDEDVGDRLARRHARWTPASLVEASPSA